MINVFEENGEFEIWLDADLAKDGLCIGSGATRHEALDAARKELRSELTQASKLWTAEITKKPS